MDTPFRSASWARTPQNHQLPDNAPNVVNIRNGASIAWLQLHAYKPFMLVAMYRVIPTRLNTLSPSSDKNSLWAAVGVSARMTAKEEPDDRTRENQIHRGTNHP